MVYTIRLRPYDGEALSSFFRRFAKANGVDLLDFLKECKAINRVIQYSDANILDQFPDSLIDIIKLGKETLLSEDTLLSGTLFYCLSRFIEGIDFGRARFISGMIRDELCYCPVCVTSSPGYKLIWRLKGIDVCLEHNTALVDSCGTCGKKIKLKDLKDVECCPYCEDRIGKKSPLTTLGRDRIVEQLWLHDAWNYLLKPSNTKIGSSDMAIRLLYIISNYSEVFEKDSVKRQTKEPGKVSTLLQHARDSLEEKRTIHLSYLMKILRENCVTLEQFFDLSVPKSFVNSILVPKGKLINQVYCISPWCSDNKQVRTLIKTGTTQRKLKMGTILNYYLACIKCGCEFAINDQGILVERTYFIKNYEILRTYQDKFISLKELAKQTGLSLDEIMRSLAFYRTRTNIFRSLDQEACKDPNLFNFNIDTSLLTLFENAIRSKLPLKEIEKWASWTSYNHYLSYRYHEKVMRTLLEMKSSRKPKIEKEEIHRKVERIVDEMFELDEYITNGTVAKKFRVSIATLQNWGCSPYIAIMKKSQYEKFVHEKKLAIYEWIDKFLKIKERERITSGQFYREHDLNRNVLWRVAPELTAYVNERIRSHNKKVRLEVNITF